MRLTMRKPKSGGVVWRFHYGTETVIRLRLSRSWDPPQEFVRRIFRNLLPRSKSWYCRLQDRLDIDAILRCYIKTRQGVTEHERRIPFFLFSKSRKVYFCLW